MLWLWPGTASVALIPPLARELTYAAGDGPWRKKKKKVRKEKPFASSHLIFAMKLCYSHHYYSYFTDEQMEA